MWPKEDRVAHTISRLSAFYPLSEADEPLWVPNSVYLRLWERHFRGSHWVETSKWHSIATHWFFPMSDEPHLSWSFF
jgi:hypothetical protein